MSKRSPLIYAIPLIGPLLKEYDNDKASIRAQLELKADRSAVIRAEGIWAGEVAPRTNHANEIQAERANANIYTCVALTKKLAASVPWGIRQRLQGEDGAVTFEDVDDHEYADVIANPNPDFTWSDLVKHMVASYLMTGNAYLGIEREGSRFELWPLEPQKMKMRLDEGSKKLAGYDYTGSRKKSYDRTEVVHIRDFDPNDPYYGLSGIEPLRRQLNTDFQADQFNDSFLANDCTPGLAYLPSHDLKDDQAERLRNSIERRGQGSSKRGRVYVATSPGDFKEFSGNSRDAAYIGLSKLNREKMFGVFSVGPALGGSLDGATFSNLEQQTQLIWSHSVIPILTALALGLTKRLFDPITEPDMEWWFDTDQVKELQDDYLVKAQTGETVIRSRQMTPNEVRQRFWGMPPIDGGDELSPAPGSGLLDSPLGDPAADAVDDEDDAGDKLFKPTKGIIVKASRRVLRVRHEQYDESAVALQRTIRKFLNGQLYRVIGGINSLTDSGKMMSSLGRFHLIVKADDDPIPANGEIIFNRAQEDEILKSQSDPVIRRIIAEYGDDAIDEIATSLSFDVTTLNVQNAAQAFANRLSKINDTTYNRIRQLLARGYEQRQTIGELSRMLRNDVAFSKQRSELVARTETVGYVNSAQREAYTQGGVEQIEWIATNDERTRPSHSAADGQIVGVNEKFNVGGVQMSHAGDPDAPIEETANCRCAIAAVV